MKRIVFLLLAYICCFHVNAQYRGNNWIFGDSIYIHFDSSAAPVVGQMNSDIGEAFSSISDNYGNIIFYSGTRRNNNNSYYSFIYDYTGAFMANSSNMYGQESATNGLIIIPDPGDTALFYVFCLAPTLPGNPLKLFYNIVDRYQNGGSGLVLQKNVLLCDSSLSEQMNAVKHANGRDWWLIAHELGSNNYIRYLITPTGITGPFVQSVGLTITIPSLAIMGECIFSEQGNQLAHAMCDGNLQLCDFDRCTGIISNPLQLGSSVYIGLLPPYGYYGCSFSQDGTKLYASNARDSLFQFDMTSSNIKGSRTLIYTNPDTNYAFAQHQLAEDGKIYISAINLFGFGLDSIVTSLSIINHPDSAVNSCGFTPFSLSLDGRLTHAGLPNNPNYALGPVVGSVCDSLSTSVSEADNKEWSVTVYPNPAQDYVTIKQDALNPYLLSVSDVSGKIFLKKEIKENSFRLDINKLPEGVYILNAVSEKKIWVRKFIKVKASD